MKRKNRKIGLWRGMTVRLTEEGYLIAPPNNPPQLLLPLYTLVNMVYNLPLSKLLKTKTMGNTKTLSRDSFGGWSNEATMFAWGAINPSGVLISKEKPNLSYEDRDKDRQELVRFLDTLKWVGDKGQINIEELLDYLYK